MGKAAENEKRRLHAAFCNNLAVGIVVTAVVVPYFALYASSNPILDTPITLSNIHILYYPVIGLLVSAFFAYLLRSLAITFVEGIQD